tara:strand:- start:760 stop:1323 length:564 start_codon:yes stop_codon:yes gene_type:complete
MKYSTNEFKPGLKILVDGDPWAIVEKEFHKPGKGQAVMRVKLKHCKTGRVIDRTYKTGESVEGAEINDVDMSYLYKDDMLAYFMDMETFEQIDVPITLIPDHLWLKEGDVCRVVLWDDKPISAEAPNFVHLSVLECEPGLKGDTASGGSKLAQLETGASIRVPLFVNTGDIIKIDTREKIYVSRQKK